LAHCIRHC
jgi:hypothetical protein